MGEASQRLLQQILFLGRLSPTIPLQQLLGSLRQHAANLSALTLAPVYEVSPRRAISGVATQMEGFAGRACRSWRDYRLSVTGGLRSSLRGVVKAGNDDLDLPQAETGVNPFDLRVRFAGLVPTRLIELPKFCDQIVSSVQIHCRKQLAL